MKWLLLSPFACVAFAAMAFAQTSASDNKQIQDAEIARIKAYSQELDDYSKRNSNLKRVFGDVSSGMKGDKIRWKEFNPKSEEDLDYIGSLMSNAFVWSKDGATTFVSCAFQNPSGDWVHYVNYYFRKDGSIARIQAQLNTFHGYASVIREMFYDPKGKLLSSSRQILDLETKKEKKPDADDAEFFDHPVPVYRTVKALPFHTLLSKPAAKTK